MEDNEKTIITKDEIETLGAWIHHGSWIPPVSDTAYKITIKALDNGYIVKVGCKRFVFENISSLLHYMKMYLKDPAKTENLFSKGKLFD